MYSSIPHLQNAIRTALAKGQICRIYQESLTACWPRLPAEAHPEAVARFAAQNGWSVALRNLGGLGVVAEFQKPDGR